MRNPWRAVTLGIAVIALFGVIIFFHFSKVPAPHSTANVEAAQKSPEITTGISSELPTRLSIPKIGVDAVIEYVALTPQGAMDVPKGPDEAGWFDLGPRPGDKGSAVIAGHEGWKDGIPAIFDNLYKLQKGDKIYVADGKGVTIAFVVRAVRTYGQNEDASGVFGSSDGKAHLNLITCEGIWSKIKKSYSGRLVVFADKEEE